MTLEWIDQLKYNSDGLVPVIAQDAATGEVLMLAYANAQALRQTLATGKATFYSRSRGEIWEKGLNSGNTLTVVDLLVDCDDDTILYKVVPSGPACHTGERSCFFIFPEAGEVISKQTAPPMEQSPFILEEVWQVLLDRKEKMPEGSYTAKLFAKGDPKTLAKITEEAAEVVNAVVHETDQRLVEETADLWFHCMILLAKRGVSIDELWNELAKRRK